MLRKTLYWAISGILTVFILTFAIYATHSLYKLRQQHIDSAKNFIDSHTLQKANAIGIKLNRDMAIAETMANTISDVWDLPTGDRITAQKSIMKNVLADNPNYTAVFLSWKLNLVDPTWTKIEGRQRVNYFYVDGKIQESTNLTDTSSVERGIYHRVRDFSKGILADPYEFEDYDNSSKKLLLATSPCYPIINKGEFLGVIGTDIELSYYSDMTDVDLFGLGQAFLISNNGIVVAHPNKELVNKPIENLNFSTINADLKKIIAAGSAFSTLFDYDFYDDQTYLSIAPILVGKEGLPWSVGIVVPLSEITKPIQREIFLTVLAAIIGALLVASITYYVASSVFNSIDKSNQQLKLLATGELDSADEFVLGKLDKLLEIGGSVEILRKELTKKETFAREIEKGNLHAHFEISSEQDNLGQSLLEMRDNLRLVIFEAKDVLSKAGEEGKLGSRISIEGKQGVWNELSQTINDLLISISNPLKSVNDIMNSLAKGDLTKRFTRQSHGDVLELANNMNEATNKLNTLLNEVVEGANLMDSLSTQMLDTSLEMSNNTSEIAGSIAEMSQGAHRQVTKVDESSQLIETILHASNQMGSQADAIDQAAQQVTENGEKGQAKLDNVMSLMSSMSSISITTNESIQMLQDRSKEISKFSTMITEISNQTNLLSLNAAIEAAQAGDAGRGFAVVAEEIRKLANSSKRSAVEIEQLVNDVQKDTIETVKVTKEMNDIIKAGVKACNEAAIVFKDIVDSSVKNKNLSNEILTAAEKQTGQINEIVSSSEHVVVIAEETAAGSEQIAASSSELSAGMDQYSAKSKKLQELAEQLKKSLEKFILKDERIFMN